MRTIAERLPFTRSEAGTMGVELELMLLDPGTGNLVPAAPEVDRLARAAGLQEQVKLEITQAMIEINSSVHASHRGLLAELTELGAQVAGFARQAGSRICGGGTHPFHRWQERSISPTSRFNEIAHRYGYLAKQFTVFGQHVHIGCTDGDSAVHLVRALGRFVPHFVALAASSPFHRSVDTSFDSCRLNIVSAFPLSGCMPPLESWEEFEDYHARLIRLGIIGSLKDLYWDLRPKPEFGTVELRIADTPLDVLLAADLAAYAQALADWAPQLQPHDWLDDDVYRHNRFQAARFGFSGRIITSELGERTTVQEDLLRVLAHLRPLADSDGRAALDRLADRVERMENGAAWLRQHAREGGDLAALVHRSCERWESACGFAEAN